MCESQPIRDEKKNNLERNFSIEKKLEVIFSALKLKFVISSSECAHTLERVAFGLKSEVRIFNW